MTSRSSLCNSPQRTIRKKKWERERERLELRSLEAQILL